MGSATVYEFAARTIEGKDQALAGYKGKVLLVVNVASECGFTPQYDALEALERELSPKGFHVLSVDGTSYTTRFVPFGLESSRCLRAFVIAGGQRAGDGSDDRMQPAQLLVDVFDGGPNTSVTCQLAGVGTFELQRSAIEDPFIVDSFERYKPALKPWVEPVRSSHVWTVAIPTSVSAGTYEMTVRVCGEYGQKHTATVVVSIAA